MAAQVEDKSAPPTSQGSTGGHGQGHGSKRGHGHGHGGGGHEEHEGAPEWLISFADNVMLQMGFFVILFSIAMTAAKSAGTGGGSGGEGSESQQPSDEQLDFALSVREAFNNPVDLGSQDPRDALLVARLRARMMGASRAKRDGRKGADQDVRVMNATGQFRAGGRIYFDAGSAALNDDGRQGSRELGQAFRGLRSALNVRGHCSAAEAFESAARGFSLSHERAMAVAHALVEEGVTWSQIRITACSDTERLTQTAYDAAGHATNQRVEVIQLDEAVQSPP